jgi:hypothetical protein
VRASAEIHRTYRIYTSEASASGPFAGAVVFIPGGPEIVGRIGLAAVTTALLFVAPETPFVEDMLKGGISLDVVTYTFTEVQVR